MLPIALKLPAVYAEFLNAFSFLNISPLLRFFRFDCMARIDHYDQVLAMTLGPIVVAALIFVAVRICGDRKAQESFANFFLLGTFFIYPSTSTVLFQTFRCEALSAPKAEGDDHMESYLRVDLRLACTYGSSSALSSGDGIIYDTQYAAMWSYSLCFVFVYPLGERAAAVCLRTNV